MKLLFVCPDWFPYSAGLAQSCLEICKGLEKQGHEIKIIVAKDKGLISKGMNIIPIPYMFRLLGRNPIPHIYWLKITKHVQWADKICLFSYMYEMNSRITIYKKIGLFNKPIIHFYRGSLEKEGTQFLSTLTKLAKKLWDTTLGHIMFTWSDKTISNSKPAIQHIQKKYRIKKNKLSYVPTGIEAHTYPKSTLKNKRVIFIGRLIENKGIKHFKEIVQVIPKKWTFTIIGNGPLEKEVVELKKKYSQIEYVGKISHDKVKEYLGKSDLLILPSYAEGSPRVVIEATACNVPCISFNVGDVNSFLPKKCLIPIGNIHLFVKTTQEFIQNHSILKKQVMKNSFKLTKTNSLIEQEIKKTN